MSPGKYVTVGGPEDGELLGASEGDSEGSDDGAEDLVGGPVGRSDGELLGASEGGSEGSEDGRADGELLGAKEGDSEGLDDGTEDTVGNMVGEADGGATQVLSAHWSPLQHTLFFPLQLPCFGTQDSSSVGGSFVGGSAVGDGPGPPPSATHLLSLQEAVGSQHSLWLHPFFPFSLHCRTRRMKLESAETPRKMMRKLHKKIFMLGREILEL